jgi:hypothetical protein
MKKWLNVLGIVLIAIIIYGFCFWLGVNNIPFAGL